MANQLKLEKSFLHYIEERAKEIPLKYRRLYVKVLSGRGSKREIIKAKCQECVGFENVADRVGNCTSIRCPIRPYRPYQKKISVGGSHE